MNLKKHFALLTLLFFSVVLSAQVKEKMITISFSKIPLSEAMARIEKTSGYTFFYDATQVNVKQEVSLNVKQVPVSKAVGEMLKGIDLSFEVTSTQIALFPKKSTPAQTGKATTIIGKVVDENGEPIIGANVLVAGTTTGVITDIDGNYKLEAPFGSSLQISYIGLYDSDGESRAEVYHQNEGRLQDTGGGRSGRLRCNEEERPDRSRGILESQRP